MSIKVQETLNFINSINSINEEINRIKQLPPLKIIWSIEGHLKDINYALSDFKKNEIVGRHFTHFEVPLMDHQIFKLCIQEKKIQKLTIKTPSVINPDHVFRWNGCLEPIIKNNKVVELQVTAILIDTERDQDPKFTHEKSEIKKEARKLLFSETGFWEWNIKTNQINWSIKRIT